MKTCVKDEECGVYGECVDGKCVPKMLARKSFNTCEQALQGLDGGCTASISEGEIYLGIFDCRQEFDDIQVCAKCELDYIFMNGNCFKEEVEIESVEPAIISEKDISNLNLALGKTDIEICDRIENENMKGLCYDDMAKALEDENLCNRQTDLELKEECKKEVRLMKLAVSSSESNCEANTKLKADCKCGGVVCTAEHYCVEGVCTGAYYVKGSSRTEAYHDFENPGKCNGCGDSLDTDGLWKYEFSVGGHYPDTSYTSQENGAMCDNGEVKINRFTPGFADDWEDTSFWCGGNSRNDICVNWHIVNDAYVKCDGGAGYCDGVDYKELDCNTEVSPNYVCITSSTYGFVESTSWGIPGYPFGLRGRKFAHCVDADESETACNKAPANLRWNWIESAQVCCGDDENEILISKAGREYCCLKGDVLDENGNCVSPVINPFN